MGKRPPLLIERGRNRLLVLVIALSFAAHLGLIWLLAEGGVSIRPRVPLVIEVELVGGRPPTAAPPVAVETATDVKKKPPSKRVPGSMAHAKKREAADVILPGKPTPSPVPTAKPTPSPSPTPRATATPRASPKPTAMKKGAPPTPKPAATAKPKGKVARKKIAGSPEAVAKEKASAQKQAAAAKKKTAAKKTAKPTAVEQRQPKSAAEAASAAPAVTARVEQMDAALSRARRAMGGGGAGTGTRVGSDVGVGDGSGRATLNPEFAAYYGLMLERIRDAWFWVGRRPELKVTIGFRVGADGKLSDIRVVQRSGDRSYDGSVLRALRAVNPLPPPPAAYRRDFSDVELVFHPADLEDAR